MKKLLDKIFTIIGIIALGIFAYKYYSYYKLDAQIEEMCLYGTLSPVRSVLKIEKQNTSQFCACWGKRMKSKISLDGIFFPDKKEMENAMDSSSFDCRRSIQGK